MRSAIDPTEQTDSGFTTRVHGAHLADLVQLHCQKQTRSVFRVFSEGQEGFLFFEHGQVHHAELDDLEGLSAVAELLQLQTGSFEPCSRPWPERGSLGMSAEALLLNAAKCIDEGLVSSTRVSLSAGTPEARSVSLGSSNGSPGANHVPRPAARSSSSGLGGAEHAGTEVQLSRVGEMVTFLGEEAEVVAEVVAFGARLASLAGDALGLGDCISFSIADSSQALVVHQNSDGGIAARKGSHAEVKEWKHTVGLP